MGGTFLKNKCYCEVGAFKTVAFITTNLKPACERLLDIMGLKYIFACFMGTLKREKRTDESSQMVKMSELSISIIFNLLQNLDNGPRRDLVSFEFAQNKLDGCDRLVNLLFKYRSSI